MKIVTHFYVNQNPQRACQKTGLAFDELESLVGRFAQHSCRAGELRGEVVEYFDGRVVIRHHFTKKLIWEMDEYGNKADLRSNEERLHSEGWEENIPWGLV